MELSEAARLLHVSEATLQRWVRQGLMPASGDADDPFRVDELRRWADERGLPFGESSARTPQRAERMLSSAVGRGAVLRGVTAANASEVVEHLVRAVPDLEADERALVLERVLDRERLASTALGHGVALPHPRAPVAGLLADPVVVVAHLRRPVDWAALDGVPVHTALLLLSPSAPVHLQLLSRVSHALKQPGVDAWLAAGTTQAEFVERVRAIEEASGK